MPELVSFNTEDGATTGGEIGWSRFDEAIEKLRVEKPNTHGDQEPGECGVCDLARSGKRRHDAI